MDRGVAHGAESEIKLDTYEIQSVVNVGAEEA